MQAVWATVFAAFDGEESVHTILEYLHYLYPVLDLVAAIVCFTYTSVSARLVVPGLGFLGLAGTFVLRIFVFNAFEFDEFGNLALISHLLTGVGLLCSLLVVVGLGLSFADMQRQIQAVGSRRRDRDDDDEDRPAWQRR